MLSSISKYGSKWKEHMNSTTLKPFDFMNCVFYNGEKWEGVSSVEFEQDYSIS